MMTMTIPFANIDKSAGSLAVTSDAALTRDNLEIGEVAICSTMELRCAAETLGTSILSTLLAKTAATSLTLAQVSSVLSGLRWTIFRKSKHTPTSGKECRARASPGQLVTFTFFNDRTFHRDGWSET